MNATADGRDETSPTNPTAEAASGSEDVSTYLTPPETSSSPTLGRTGRSLPSASSKRMPARSSAAVSLVAPSAPYSFTPCSAPVPMWERDSENAMNLMSVQLKKA